MKRYATAIAAILISCGFAAVGFAQTTSSSSTAPMKPGTSTAKPEVTIVSEPGTQNLHLDELKAFDEIAQSHPDMAKSIASKPALIESNKFVAKYPELQDFLTKYPDARDNIRHNPGDYVEPVASSSWKHGPKASAGDGAADSDGNMKSDHGAMKDGGAMKGNGSMNDMGAMPNSN